MHLIIFMWGFTGILGKLIHLDAIIIVWYRILIAVSFLVLFFLFTKKSFKIEKKYLWKISLIGMIVASHWLTFYYSIQLSTASLGILCLSTTTLHVTWLEPLVMKRRFSWIEFLLGCCVVYGIYFVAGDFSPKENDSALLWITLRIVCSSLLCFQRKNFAESSIDAYYPL